MESVNIKNHLNFPFEFKYLTRSFSFPLMVDKPLWHTHELWYLCLGSWALYIKKKKVSITSIGSQSFTKIWNIIIDFQCDNHFIIHE